MKTSFPLLLLTLLLLSNSLSAATISLSITSNGGPMFSTSDGDLLTMGSCVRIGLFDLSGGNLTTIQTSNDYFAVDALFTPLGENGGAAGESAQANNASSTMLMINDFFGVGNILGLIGNIEFAYLASGRQLFAWVFNTAAPEDATEWGIYSATSGWDSPNAFASETLATFEIDTILRGSTTGGITISDRLSLSPVPEPGSLLLILGSALAFTARRSRHR
jgi:hypothetical protein